MQKIELFTMPDYNNRIANWIYYNGSAITDQATDQSKDTVILYYYSMILSHDGAWFTFWNRQPEARNGISVIPTNSL